MSWQAYVDQSLVGTGNIDKAIIADATGKTIWAQTPGFSVSDAERQAIAESFGPEPAQNAPPKKIVSEGFKVAGQKYVTLGSDEDSLKGKLGKEGLVAMKTTQALLIAHHPDTVQTPVAYNSVAELADYLKKVGY